MTSQEVPSVPAWDVFQALFLWLLQEDSRESPEKVLAEYFQGSAIMSLLF